MNNKKMKTIITIAIIFSSLFAKAQKGSIKVNILGVKEARGKVQLNLYNSDDSFLESDEVYKVGTMKASTSQLVYTFEEIPMGTYAIHAFWDEDEDGEMKANFIGMPKEELGFSQNVFGTFGPPDFEDTSFKVADGQTTELVIYIKMPSHF